MISQVLLVITILFVSVGAEEWRTLSPIRGTTEELTVTIKGKPTTYYRAGGLRVTVTGPGGVRIISRWIGPRPTQRDTSYTLTVVGGTRKVVKTYTSRKSSIAGVIGRRLWVSKSRTTYVSIPPRTTQLVLTCPDKNVFVKVQFSQKPRLLGKLTPKSPDRYADIVRLERKETEVKYYRATANTPVEIELIGPTTLVFYSRLEFTYDMKGVQNYQVQIVENSQVIHSFTWSASRSDVTRYLEGEDLVPSGGKRCVVRVSPGVHRWSFKPGSALHSLLLRFFIPEKDI